MREKSVADDACVRMDKALKRALSTPPEPRKKSSSAKPKPKNKVA